MQMGDGGPAYSAPAAACAAEVLKALKVAGQSLSLAELERELGRSKSLIFRVVRELVDEELLARNADGRYELGIEALELGASYTESFDFDGKVRRVLEEVADRTGETVNMGVLRGAEVSYVMKFVGQSTYVTISRVGGRVPATCTAIGKALLAGLTDDEVRGLLSDPLPHMTPNSITRVDELLQRLAIIRERGYAVDRGEAVMGRCGLALRISLPQGPNRSAAISLSTSEELFVQRQEEYLAMLRLAGDQIARESQGRQRLEQVGAKALENVEP